jgi:hypothetical protein
MAMAMVADSLTSATAAAVLCALAAYTTHQAELDTVLVQY